MDQAPESAETAQSAPPRADRPKRVVVAIPALNEEKSLAKVIGEIPREFPGAVITHIVVIDDGSRDRTAEVAAEYGALVITHHRNLGSGAAFASGRAKAIELGADIVCHMDGDGQFSSGDIPKLLEPILTGKADFVTCSRFASKEVEPEMPRRKKWGNHMVTWLVNKATGSHFTDVSCGFRAYTRETAYHLHLFSQFDHPQETLMLLSKRNVRMVEVPLRIRGVREHGESRLASSVISYGVRCGSVLLLTFRDMHPLRFFGILGSIFFALGFFLGAWVLTHWWFAGTTVPYTSFLTGSALGIILGILFCVFALLADMMVRHREITEQAMIQVQLLKDELLRRDKP